MIKNIVKACREYSLINADGEEYKSFTPGKFGGHRKLKIYGKLDCPSVARYIAKGQYVKYRVFFPDEETAIAAGYDHVLNVCRKLIRSGRMRRVINNRYFCKVFSGQA